MNYTEGSIFQISYFSYRQDSICVFFIIKDFTYSIDKMHISISLRNYMVVHYKLKEWTSVMSCPYCIGNSCETILEF